MNENSDQPIKKNQSGCNFDRYRLHLYKKAIEIETLLVLIVTVIALNEKNGHADLLTFWVK